MFAGIILAAGRCVRMDFFKPLLSINGTTFIRNIINNMRKAGITNIIVVTGYNSEELKEHLSGYDVTFVHNVSYESSDMLSSVKLALSVVDKCAEGIFITPCDIPLPDKKIYEALMQEKSVSQVKRPCYKGISGHPILISSSCSEIIMKYNGPGGLSGAITENKLSVTDVQTDSDVILADADTPEDYIRMLHPISAPIKRVDHDEKITGSVKYVSDYLLDSNGNEILYGHLLRSTNAHALIDKVTLPPLPEGYFFFGPKDAPKNISLYPCNDLPSSMSEEEKEALQYSTPLFADKETEYYGQPLGIMVGPCDKTVRELISKTVVEYTPLEAVITLSEAKKDFITFDRHINDYESAFSEADEIYEEEFDTGYQYQAYLETQSIMAEFDPDKRLHVHGSMQCPFVVRRSVAFALDIKEEDVRVSQDAMGGAFGGKEDFPSLLAPQVALAAYKTGRSVRVAFDRNEDIQFASKRHPSHTQIRFALKDGKITAMEANAMLNAGASISSSGDVAMVYFYKMPCMYSFDAIHINLKVMKTNTPPCGAFRGFGNPQAVFAIDMAMSHLASHLHEDEIEFKKKYFASDNTPTSNNGKYYFHVPIPELLSMAYEATDFEKKRSLYSKPQTGRYRRGIGIGFGNQGCTFGGGGEWDGVKATPKIIKHKDGTITIETSQVEMGQGIRTAFTKIASQALNIPTDMIDVHYPDTDLTNNTGPTAASRSVMVVGSMVYEAAKKLKENWIDGEEQIFTATYTKPPHMGDFDPETHLGDAFADYIWDITVLEIMVDTITGKVKILDAYGVYNVGTPIDINILRGQMEGGLLQGIGYAAYERLVYGPQGRMFNTAFADYHIPTFKDVDHLHVDFQYEEFPYGPFGAKGCGELPIAGPGAAYLNALEQALGGTDKIKLTHIPFVAEDISDALKGINQGENHE